VTPTPEILHGVLSQVLESFAYALPTSRQDAGDLPLTVQASLPHEKGWLVLRTTPALAQRLAEDSVGDDAENLALDALTELCNLSVSHLVDRVWGAQHGAFKAFVPKPGLPAGRCETKSLLDVDGEPLEAGYWVPV
jgi:hypothetical protein